MIASQQSMSHPYTPPLHAPRSVAEASFLDVNGTKQWVLVRGEDVDNPPLVFLHGGPGMSEAGFFRYYNASLESAYTCVNWDQRGAGKSFSPDIPLASMNVEQFIADLDVVVDHVRARVGRQSVVLFGHSWGSALGVLYAARFPEKVSVYVGSGQLGDWAASEASSYRFALAEAQRQRKARAERELRAIGAPPYDADALWVQRNWLARLEGSIRPRALVRQLRMVLGVPESSVFEVRGVFRSLRWSLDAMWPEVQHLNLLEKAPALAMPVFFLLGRNDHWVPPETSLAYFDALHAPSKALVWFEHSGHEPFADEPAAWNAAMRDLVRPVALQAFAMR